LGGFRDEAREHCRALRRSLEEEDEEERLLSAIVDDEYGSDSSSDSSGSNVGSDGSDSSASNNNSINTINHRPSSPVPLMATTDFCRGLEARCCLERQRRKYLTNKCIVRAQSKVSGEQLALLAQRCTAWAAELAAREGARDYFRAYCSNGSSASATKRLAGASEFAGENGGFDGRRVRPRRTHEP
jgi:hypothetical protein